MGVGPQTPLGCLRGRSPAGTCRNIYADRRARLRQTILVPVHPLRSTRRSEPWCEPPNRAPCVPAARTDGSIPRQQRHPLSPPGCLRIRLRIPLRSPGGISGPTGQPARPTRASSRGSPVLMYMLACGQPSRSICCRNAVRPVAARRESPF